ARTAQAPNTYSNGWKRVTVRKLGRAGTEVSAYRLGIMVFGYMEPISEAGQKLRSRHQAKVAHSQDVEHGCPSPMSRHLPRTGSPAAHQSALSI
ncbi:hypothetical protein, partial [Streptomyces sp. NPDC054834]